MNSKFKVFKYKSNKVDKFDDSISIEEPLEIILKYLNKKTNSPAMSKLSPVITLCPP